MIEPPPRELADLFAAEKAAPTVTTVGKQILRARIAASVGHAPLGAAVSGAVVGTAGKILVLIALVAGATIGARALKRHGEAHRAAGQARVADQAIVASPSTIATPRPERASVAAALPPETPPPRSRSVRARIGVPAETTLLASAWAAVEAGDGSRALEMTDKDAALHPRGELREERGALRVLALAKLRRKHEAQDAARLFVSEFPASVHIPLIEEAIASEEEP